MKLVSSVVAAGFLCTTGAVYALPFNITPVGTLPTITPSVATYLISNNTSMALSGNLVKWLPPNTAIDPSSTCSPSSSFYLPAGGSCTLVLNITGNIHYNDTDPHHHLFVCASDQASCSGPTQANSLNVTNLSFSGIRTNLAESQVLEGGFTKCFQETYNIPFGTDGTALKTGCTQNVLLVACRPVGTTTLTVAAMALRSDALLPVPATSTGSHVSNGTQWYFSDDYSFGFAKAGDPLERDSCDVDSVNANLRLCWHTITSTGGYRCGSTTGLNGSTAWERVAYQRNGSV